MYVLFERDATAIKIALLAKKILLYWFSAVVGHIEIMRRRGLWNGERRKPNRTLKTAYSPTPSQYRTNTKYKYFILRNMEHIMSSFNLLDNYLFVPNQVKLAVHSLFTYN